MKRCERRPGTQIRVAGIAIVMAWLVLCYAAVAVAAPDIEMVFVKGGCFRMGDISGEGFPIEKPSHEVCVTDFFIGKYEVTQGQWKDVMGNNPSGFQDCGMNCPVEQVSWDDAQDFINRLNKQTGKKYRLPTEAEWEYAARSGGKVEEWAGTNGPKELGTYLWVKDNSGMKTHPVGEKRPNGLGIYDMSGNVWEWVKDRFGPAYYKESPKDNPTGPLSGEDRVFRGGSWAFDPWNSRTACRDGIGPSNRDTTIGIRLALPSR